MSSVQAYANRLAWADRAERGREDEPRQRPTWVFPSLRRHLCDDEFAVGLQHAALWIRANGCASGDRAFVDAGGRDYHAGPLDRALCERRAIAAESAVFAAVHAHQYDCFALMFVGHRHASLPHALIAHLQPDRNLERLARRLAYGLRALRDYHDGLASRALDGLQQIAP